ncbi:polyketide synthase dehydratase domain-containing protein, partial [Priestia megaterium]|uniref:polyketide synthase dehydratase domain-containing protein n=1 Tax=Priestia megaterium TaxID=1404 RepID=UPI003F68A326
MNEDHIINNEATNQGTILSSKVESEEVLVPEVYESDELYLRDHKVNGEPVLIGMTHASLAINAFYKNFPLEENVHLHRLTFMKPIVVNEGQKVEVLTQATKKDARTDFQVVYRYEPTSPWTVTAKGTLQKSSLERKTINVNMLKSTMKELEDFDHIYTFNPAIELGDSFKIISGLYTGENQVLARVDLRNVLQQENHEYAIHPLMIYLAFQALFPLLDQVDVKEGFLPFGIQDIHFQRVKDLEQFWVLVKIVKNSGEMVIFDAELINDQSQIFARLLGCSTKRIRFGDKVDMNENPEKIQSYASGETVNTESVNEEIRKYLTGKLIEIIDVGAKLNHIEANLMDLGLESAQFIKLADEIEKEIKINLN